MAVPELLAPSGDAYALKVRGDSMIDAHIRPLTTPGISWVTEALDR